jgi:intein-encoded DNA endonuclease-like protein
MAIELEKALENNKQTILQLIKNIHSTEDEIKRISLLRDEAKLLINMITHELRCDQNVIQCNRTNACKSVIVRFTWVISVCILFE